MMTRRPLGKSLAILIASLIWAMAPAAAGERIGVPAVGITIDAPDGWQRTSGEAAMAHLGNVRVEDAELRRRLGSGGNRPIIALRKLPLARAGGIPILNIGFHALAALAGDTPVQILDRTVRVARQAFGDIEVLDPPAETRIAGFGGAHLRIAYTQVQSGIRVPSVSEYWIVIRGGFYFVIAGGYPPDDPPATRAEILAAVRSIRIEPAN